MTGRKLQISRNAKFRAVSACAVITVVAFVALSALLFPQLERTRHTKPNAFSTERDRADGMPPRSGHGTEVGVKASAAAGVRGRHEGTGAEESSGGGDVSEGRRGAAGIASAASDSGNDRGHNHGSDDDSNGDGDGNGDVDDVGEMPGDKHSRVASGMSGADEGRAGDSGEDRGERKSASLWQVNEEEARRVRRGQRQYSHTIKAERNLSGIPAKHLLTNIQ